MTPLERALCDLLMGALYSHELILYSTADRVGGVLTGLTSMGLADYA